MATTAKNQVTKKNSRVRQAGSGFTTFQWRGSAIAWLESFTDSGQSPGGSATYEAITPLGHRHPKEIVTPRYLAEGTLACVVRELWEEPVWWQLAGLAGTYDIVDIFNKIADMNDEIVCQTLIKPPGNRPWRGWVYHNIVVVPPLPDGENITQGALSIPRTLNLVYTHRTPYNGQNA